MRPAKQNRTERAALYCGIMIPVGFERINTWQCLSSLCTGKDAGAQSSEWEWYAERLCHGQDQRAGILSDPRSSPERKAEG